MYLITRSIEIDMGHRIPTHGSKCASLHGHRYKIIAGAYSERLVSNGVETGMVMDFGRLKQAMMENIHDVFDHAFAWHIHDPALDKMHIESMLSVTLKMLRDPRSSLGNISHIAPIVNPDALPGPPQRMVFMRNIPTAENLASAWFGALAYRVPTLKYVEVHETPNCMARYEP